VNAGTGNNGENESAGAVNCAAGANGTPAPLMEAAGSEILIWAEDGDANGSKATIAAKRRSVFTIGQV
jgi:hypothetical protein